MLATFDESVLHGRFSIGSGSIALPEGVRDRFPRGNQAFVRAFLRAASLLELEAVPFRRKRVEGIADGLVGELNAEAMAHRDYGWDVDRSTHTDRVRSAIDLAEDLVAYEAFRAFLQMAVPRWTLSIVPSGVGTVLRNPVV